MGRPGGRVGCVRHAAWVNATDLVDLADMDWCRRGRRIRSIVMDGVMTAAPSAVAEGLQRYAGQRAGDRTRIVLRTTPNVPTLPSSR